jgi:uncharacterized membrane protein
MTELATIIRETAEKPTEQLASIIIQRTRELGSLSLAVIYTIGHIFIAILCASLIFNASFNLAAIDAFIEPIVNGFWFYLLFEVFNKYKQKYRSSAAGKSSKNPSSSMSTSKLAPINNKKNLD